MQIIADLHIHSKYSRAVSQKMDLYEIASWAAKKGIGLVTTADWTHPLWMREIKTKLKEVALGVYELKDPPINQRLPVRFILTTEIASIYNQGGKLRRIHNLVFSPSIETAERINDQLKKKGVNLMADGRPITGISSKDLLSMLLEINPAILFVPCHAWTPWFSLYGSKSGFDSIKECFNGLDNEIYAIETGLSSDPIMNWQIKELKNRSIISSSDAHSGPKLGREATVFVPTTQQYNNATFNFTYQDIIKAIKQSPNSKLKIGYTIEFFPEEGKYHWSGHRACGIRYSAKETKEKGIICPVCQKPLTIGVENRVLDLSEQIIEKEELHFLPNRAGVTFVYDKEKVRKPFVSIVPLMETLIEVTGSPVKAAAEYEKLTTSLGTEFEILLKKSLEEIEKTGGQKLRQAIEIIRKRKVFVDPGYDGVFGKVKIFDGRKENEEKQLSADQPSLF